MFRKRLFDDAVLRLRHQLFPSAGLFELWSRLMDCCVFANIGSVLLYYRLHDQSVGRLATDKQLASATAVRKQMLQKLGFEPTEKELALHNDLACCRIQKSRDFWNRLMTGCCKSRVLTGNGTCFHSRRWPWFWPSGGMKSVYGQIPWELMPAECTTNRRLPPLLKCRFATIWLLCFGRYCIKAR